MISTNSLLYLKYPPQPAVHVTTPTLSDHLPSLHRSITNPPLLFVPTSLLLINIRPVRD